MELKPYQKVVVADLARYLQLLVQTGSASRAYCALWEEKGVPVDSMSGMPRYVDGLAGAPQVCAKVPTGGGKTFLAASVVRTIFDAMPRRQAQAVVWLVPSDAILSQTLRALTTPGHPYRQRLDTDFGHRVEVYSKEQALMGQNFSPTTVMEKLSVFVFSYDSFRTSKKEGRKAYQQNGSLEAFAGWMRDPAPLLDDTDETALIQVIRSLNPVVIVDESHHASSQLSLEMLRNFNPSFVLDLTATPRKNSNIISIVDAVQLKRANMIKLPVIVYNRKTQMDVYTDAITLRSRLERQAEKDRQTTRRYIRPIVLFQAQPRGREDSATYEKIKQTLIDAGIPEQEIAIKTADRDELKHVDLLSPDCPIRYIITVNALKEGWDCPFAYILATVANRTSAVDVEQILGRVLRLPYTAQNPSEVLNLSYVLTSSADFHQTLEKVVKGLNDAGFSDRDYRARDVEAVLPADPPAPKQMALDPAPDEEEPDAAALRDAVRAAAAFLFPDQPAQPDAGQNPAEDLLAHAAEEGRRYRAAIAVDASSAPQEVRDKMNQFRMNDAFAEEAAALQLPQFMLRVEPNLFSNDEVTPLTAEHLSGDFSLTDKDAQIDFSTVAAEMARVDVDDSANATPKVWRVLGQDAAYFRQWFNGLPSEQRLHQCKRMIKKQLSKIDCVDDSELDGYIDRVVACMTKDERSELEQSPAPYVLKIRAKVNALLDEHRAAVFDLWLEQDKITCLPNYSLPKTISPIRFTSMIPKSLYAAEEEMNGFERDMAWKLSGLANVKWWHRNIARRGFVINGAVNMYPDFIVMLHSGKILMVETKGDHLENDDSRAKAKLGRQWADHAGSRYKYYMVYQNAHPDYEGAYAVEKFWEIVKGL